MMAVDTSALMAILLNESRADACIDLLAAEPDLIISAVTVGEALIVSENRGIAAEMTRLLDGIGFDVLPVTAESARRVSDAYRQWGRGRHEAGLNFGDCFAYDAAKSNDCPLLFVGDDFSKTDIRPALAV
jgi:ribonuclease VapC